MFSSCFCELNDLQMIAQLYYQMASKNINMKETFHGFHSQREETTHSLEAKSNSRIKNNSEQSSDISIQFSINHTVRTLIMEFKKALKQDGYKCIEMGQKQLLLIRLTFYDRFRKLFLCKQPPKLILEIKTLEFLSVRSVTIKPLRSNSAFSYIQYSPNELYKIVYNIRSLLTNLDALDPKHNPLNINELDTEYQQDFYSLDSTSYYMYSRMLVESNYSLAQKIAVVLNRYRNENRIENLSKEELRWLSDSMSEISDNLLQGFNCSRKELLEILSYCRKSVELFFHNLHHQSRANEQFYLEYDSDKYTQQKIELNRIVPETLKAFHQLERSHTSMDIFKSIIYLNLLLKAEIQIKRLPEAQVNQCLNLIRTCFSSVMNDKTRLIKCFGFSQDYFQGSIIKFNFDHEITF